MNLKKSEKTILEILCNSSWARKENINAKKTREIAEKHFIELGWMEENGTFKTNLGGEACVKYIDYKDLV